MSSGPGFLRFAFPPRYEPPALFLRRTVAKKKIPFSEVRGVPHEGISCLSIFGSVGPPTAIVYSMRAPIIHPIRSFCSLVFSSRQQRVEGEDSSPSCCPFEGFPAFPITFSKKGSLSEWIPRLNGLRSFLNLLSFPKNKFVVFLWRRKTAHLHQTRFPFLFKKARSPPNPLLGCHSLNHVEVTLTLEMGDGQDK